MDARQTYSTEAVAKMIGVSRQSIHMWIRGGKIAAPQSVAFGQRPILLWTAADIERAKKVKGSSKKGRPRTRSKTK